MTVKVTVAVTENLQHVNVVCGSVTVSRKPLETLSNITCKDGQSIVVTRNLKRILNSMCDVENVLCDHGKIAQAILSIVI